MLSISITMFIIDLIVQIICSKVSFGWRYDYTVYCLWSTFQIGI